MYLYDIIKKKKRKNKFTLFLEPFLGISLFLKVMCYNIALLPKK